MGTFVDENGEAAEPPPGMDPINPKYGFARLQAIILCDLHVVGMSYRKIGKLFHIPETSVRRIIGCVPEDLANRGRDARYLRRLTEVVESKPTSFQDLMERMLAKAGTPTESVGDMLAGLGNRRRSLETAVALRQRRKKPEHADGTD